MYAHLILNWTDAPSCKRTQKSTRVLLGSLDMRIHTHAHLRDNFDVAVLGCPREVWFLVLFHVCPRCWSTLQISRSQMYISGRVPSRDCASAVFPRCSRNGVALHVTP